MGNRACSSLCYSVDHTTAVNDDDHRKTTAAAVRRLSIAKKTATTVWSNSTLGTAVTSTKLGTHPNEERDVDDNKNVDEEDSVDTYYKILTQHESTNRFSRTHREVPLGRSPAMRASTAEGTDEDVAAVSARQLDHQPEIPPNGNSFEYTHHSMSSGDTHSREAREGSIGYGRRASMTGEREEIQDDIMSNRSSG